MPVIIYCRKYTTKGVLAPNAKNTSKTTKITLLNCFKRQCATDKNTADVYTAKKKLWLYCDKVLSARKDLDKGFYAGFD